MNNDELLGYFLSQSEHRSSEGLVRVKLACFQDDGLKQIVQVDVAHLENYNFGELVEVKKIRPEEPINGALVELKSTERLRQKLNLHQEVDHGTERIIYMLKDVDLREKKAPMEEAILHDIRQTVAAGFYSSIFFQVQIPDPQFNVVILQETPKEKDMGLARRFETMWEMVRADNEEKLIKTGALLREMGRFVLEGFDKANAFSGPRLIISLAERTGVGAFRILAPKLFPVIIVKMKMGENGQWMDEEQVEKCFVYSSPQTSLKLLIKASHANKEKIEKLFKIGDSLRLEPTLSEKHELFWRNGLQTKSEVFRQTVEPNPDATEEERFQGVLEEKVMEKEALDRLRDKMTSQNHLNRIQHKAVMMALNDERKLVCIQGPPGTGKSHTLSVIISKFIMKKRGEVVRRKAIVLTPTREACRNIMEMTKSVAKKMEVPDLHEHTFMDAATFNKILENSPEQEKLARFIDNLEKEFADGKIPYDELQDVKRSKTALLLKEKTEEIMTNVRVIFSTIASSFVDTATRTKGFENALCIIDEAGQVKESETWPAVMKMSRIVMAGDPSQLPAVVISEKARKSGLAVSLMERLKEKKDQYSWIMLENQYRSHRDITEWSSNTFYGKSIKNDGPTAPILENLAVQPDNSVVPLFSPFVLVDTSYESQKPLNMKTFENGVAIAQATQAGSDLSYANLREGEIVVEHFLNLRRRGIKVQDVAIITPYTAQKELVQGLIKEHIRKEIEEGREDVLEFEKVKIGTVDSYQGQEFLAVIFSMVRSNPKFHLGFVEDLRRLNVAITRAKKHFMLVGNGIMLQKSRIAEIKNLFDIFVRDRHRFPPSFVFGNATPYGLTSTKTNFGLDLVDFLKHCKGKDEKMARHCEIFAKKRKEFLASAAVESSRERPQTLHRRGSDGSEETTEH